MALSLILTGTPLPYADETYCDNLASSRQVVYVSNVITAMSGVAST